MARNPERNGPDSILEVAHPLILFSMGFKGGKAEIWTSKIENYRKNE
jgi:hypothetical protein